MRHFTITIIYFIICTQYVFGQLSYLNTDKPEQGKKITINYKITPESKLTAQDSIFSGIQYWDEQGSYYTETLKLTKSSVNIWSTTFEVPKDAAYLSIRFYHLFKDDSDATINQMIYHHGVPAKGATYQDFSGEKLHEKFNDEINRYPTNYFAYARYMNALPADTMPKILPLLTAKLIKVKNRDEGLLSALVAAYSKQGKIKEAYLILIELLEKYPNSSATQFSFSLYLYEQYKTGGSMLATGELYEILKKIFIQYPNSRIAGDNNNILTLKNDNAIPTAAFENVLLNLYNTNRIAYNAMGILPNFYLKRNIKLDEAERLLKHAINALISGEIYHQYRLPPSYIYSYTSEYLRVLAKIYTRQNRSSEAIITFSAALQQLRGSSFEGSIRPALETELASAFSKAGNYTVALDMYKKMYSAGNEKVKDSITQLYIKTSSRTEVDAFLASSTTNKPANGELKIAPPFSGTDLSGNPIKLSDYKGKIVVINAWFIGCVPCIAEMPELNQLVNSYAKEKDIIFLGLTPDKTEELSKFLQKKSFKYSVVNNLKGMQPYEFTIYPQHIVIDQNGNIVYRTAGSIAGIAKILSEAIDKLKK